MSDERETEIVAGIVSGITQKGEQKWQIEVKPDGSQYSKKLWTKSRDQQALASTLIGQSAVFECGVSHWENSQGQPVRSLWVNAINPGTLPQTTPSEATGAPQTPSQPQSVSRPPANDPRQYSIERQAAGKAAAHRYQGTDASVDDVLYLAKRLADFFASGEVVAPEPQPLPVDEDIPF